MTNIAKLAGLWGLYWLGHLNSWKTPILRKEQTDNHRCCIYTPTQHVVWLSCRDDVCIDYGRPYRYSYWKIFSQVEPPLKTSIARSLSPYPSRRLKTRLIKDKYVLEIEESSGFGHEFLYKNIDFHQDKDVGQAMNTFFGKASLTENVILLRDSMAEVEIETNNVKRVLENEAAIVALNSDEKSVILDKKEESITIDGPSRIRVKFRHIPRRWAWLQPFALVWDYIENEDELYTQYLEVYVSEYKYVFLSRSPVKTISLNNGMRLEVYFKEEVKIMKKNIKDLTSIGTWVSMNMGKTSLSELPTLRLSPSIVVPYLMRLQPVSEDRWRLTLGLSNPTSINTSISILIDKPFFLESIKVDNEDIMLDKLNYVELFFPSYSAQSIEMLLRRKKEKMLIGRLGNRKEEAPEQRFGGEAFL